jgi:uncharacterized protein (TIGR00730 family)
MAKKKPSAFTTGVTDFDQQIERLLDQWEISYDREQFRQMLVAIYKFSKDEPHPADIRLFKRAMKEMRYADTIFKPYREVRKISIFGSARTPPGQPEYETAKQFASLMRNNGFMVITGGGEGIMGAAQEGAGRERSFALNITLPFEQEPNATIAGDKKLINFKYFFTRKVNFVKNSDAVACCPGGFGTMDEAFETITLLQTGKAPIIPIVFLDAPGGNFWNTFKRYLKEHLLRDGLISESDFHLFMVTDDPNRALSEVSHFYYNYHSMRWVGKTLVIRLHRQVPEGALHRLREDFADILTDPSEMKCCSALKEEINEPELSTLPRLCVPFNRRAPGRLRQLIDRLNQF